MSVNVLWDNEDKTVLRYEFTTPWTWDEYYSAACQAEILLKEAQHSSDTIVDFTAVGGLPIGALTHLRHAAELTPSNGPHTTVMTGVSPYIKTIDDLMAKLFPGTNQVVRHAKSVDEARRILAKAPQPPAQ